MTEAHPVKQTEVFKSESSIFSHPIQRIPTEQTVLPTWSLEVTAVIACIAILYSIIRFSRK